MEKLDNIEENNDYIEKLKRNYYDFMKHPRGQFCRLDEIVNDHQKEEYVVVFQELIDTSLMKVQCLTEEETDIVRKWIGVSGKEYTSINELAKDLDLTYGILDRKIKEAYKHLLHRIMRGFVDLEEAVLNGDISKDELCNLPIDILYDLSPKMHNYISYVNGERINTVGELINNSIETIQKRRGMSVKATKILVDYIHSLGLNFKDENSYESQMEDWYKYVGFDGNIDSDKYTNFNQKSETRQSIRLRLLLEKLKTISEQEAIYDKEITKLMIKKQELQESKIEIQNELLKIQPENVSEDEKGII